MNRELDGVYFRIERNGKWQQICYRELTEEKRKKIREKRKTE